MTETKECPECGEGKDFSSECESCGRELTEPFFCCEGRHVCNSDCLADIHEEVYWK